MKSFYKSCKILLILIFFTTINISCFINDSNKITSEIIIKNDSSNYQIIYNAYFTSKLINKSSFEYVNYQSNYIVEKVFFAVDELSNIKNVTIYPFTPYTYFYDYYNNKINNPQGIEIDSIKIISVLTY